MLISENALTHFLIDNGLIDRETVVDGDLLIAETSSRNRNFKIIQPDGSGLFVKQAQDGDSQSSGLLQREGMCYWLAANDPAFLPLKPQIPEYRLFDVRRYLLVIEFLSDGENLREYHRRVKGFPMAEARRLGEILGTIHREITVDGIDHETYAQFPRRIPWVLSAHRTSHAPVTSLRGVNQQILSIIHQFSDFHAYLDVLYDSWQFDFFIHGDMKWENCIVFRNDGKTLVKIIDWETCDFGDACWDVGAIFQAYLSFWIMSMPVHTDSTPDEFLENAPYPLELMQPAIHAFWSTYGQIRGLDESEQKDVLIRSVNFAAARMIQTAFEHMHYSPQITTVALSLLQVSLNILKDSENAAQDLFGL